MAGISITNVTGNSPNCNLFPSVESIAEIRVQGVGNAAEYGAPSDITTTSKSGTNDVHRAAFWYQQNRTLDARSFGQTMLRRKSAIPLAARSAARYGSRACMAARIARSSTSLGRRSVSRGRPPFRTCSVPHIAAADAARAGPSIRRSGAHLYGAPWNRARRREGSGVGSRPNRSSNAARDPSGNAGNFSGFTFLFLRKSVRLGVRPEAACGNIALLYYVGFGRESDDSRAVEDRT